MITVAKGSKPGPIHNNDHGRPSLEQVRTNSDAGQVEEVEAEIHVEKDAAVTDNDVEKGPPSLRVTVSNASYAAQFAAEAEKYPNGSWDEDGNFYPEGGREAWLVTLGSFCAMFACFGLLNTMSTFNAFLTTNQLKGTDENAISWLFSINAFLVFFCGLQIGPIFDAKGPRWLVIAGSLLLFVSVLCMGNCTKYWHFVLDYSIMAGIASSLLFTPAVASIAHYFARRRSFITGIACTGGSFGGVVYPLMLQSLIPKVGWAWSLRILAFIILALSLTGVLLMRSRLPPKRASGGIKDMLPDLSIFWDGDGAMAATTAGVFFLEWGLFVPTAYLTTYALANGVDERFSYQLIAIFNAGSCFGRFIPGYIADRVGRFNTMLAFTALCALSALCLWLPAGGSVGLLVAYSVVFGFASGSNISLTPSCVGQLCDTRQYGRYYASCYTFVAFGTLTGIPIAGALLQLTNGNYYGLIIFTGCCYTAALACFAFVRVVRRGWSYKVRW